MLDVVQTTKRGNKKRTEFLRCLWTAQPCDGDLQDSASSSTGGSELEKFFELTDAL